MSRGIRTALWLGMSLTGGAWAAGEAEADLPQYCRDLAAQFATAPGQLGPDALAALRACEEPEIQQRSGAPNEAPPPAPQPDPSGASPIDKPGWGQWSAPAPWNDGQEKSQTWGDFKNP